MVQGRKGTDQGDEEENNREYWLSAIKKFLDRKNQFDE